MKSLGNVLYFFHQDEKNLLRKEFRYEYLINWKGINK